MSRPARLTLILPRADHGLSSYEGASLLHKALTVIPIGLPSIEFVLIRLAYLGVTLFWLAWLVRLGLSQKARLRLRSWRGAAFLICGAIACYSIWAIYDFNRHLDAYRSQHQAQYYPVLAMAHSLGGIDMPAGTKLKLALAYQLASFERATFAFSINIGGVDTLLAERYIAIRTDADYQSAGFSVENLRLTGIGESAQAGWVCDASSPIVFLTHPDGSIARFESCTAAAGNLIQDAALPQGADIIATQGRVFLNGTTGADRWLIQLPPDARFSSHGISQIGGALWLDADRKIIDRVTG